MSTKHGLACARVDPLGDGGVSWLLKQVRFLVALQGVIGRVTTCLENPEVSGNLTAVREMSGNCQGKNLVREKLPKTVYCKLHICVHTGI